MKNVIRIEQNIMNDVGVELEHQILYEGRDRTHAREALNSFFNSGQYIFKMQDESLSCPIYINRDKQDFYEVHSESLRFYVRKVIIMLVKQLLSRPKKNENFVIEGHKLEGKLCDLDSQIKELQDQRRQIKERYFETVDILLEVI